MRPMVMIAASALLLAAGCTDNYGRVDYGRTALLGVGVGAAAALAVGALSDRPRPYRGNYDRGGGYGRGGYGSGYGGYGGGYRQPSYGGYGDGYGRPNRGGW